MTIIYPSPIFGPVISRRLGVSLGINLQPDDGKMCSFDCIYCECGLNADFRPKHRRPAKEVVAAELEKKLQAMAAEENLPDVLTFAGNGEPTGHPDFLDIIRETIRLRDTYCPKAKVTVLSNATLCGKENVREALMMVDNNILKLDTVSDEYIRIVNRPANMAYDVKKVVEWMKAYNGHCIVQTMFMKGTAAIWDADGNISYIDVDNLAEEYVKPWLDAVAEIKPSQVMIYTIDRETPVAGLMKASHEELDAIKARVEDMGIRCSASY
ncbi:MAG: radical SAM protein [Prevotella sp.]|nr:radical SAM protein [Prevotella sp.]